MEQIAPGAIRIGSAWTDRAVPRVIRTAARCMAAAMRRGISCLGLINPAVAAMLLALWPGPAAAQELAGHGGPVRALAVLPEGLASAGFDAAVILWDVARGQARQVMR